MKRIGILTFHRSINYGAFMQAYALSHEIATRYENVIVEIVDFEKKIKHEMYQKPLFGLKNHIIYGNEYKLMYDGFQNDLSKLSLSSQTLITDDYERVFDFLNGKYDIIIVGSDAVWAYNHFLGLKNPYWLFGNKLECIKMSYAASAYSLDFKNVSQIEKEYIAGCLESFSYIGVRDEETMNFIKSCNSSLNIELNCDPTVLLPIPSRYDAELILDKYNINPNKKIVSLMLSTNPYIELLRKELRGNYEIIRFYKRNRWYDRYIFIGEKFLPVTPFEWYKIYAACNLNITNYFHGTLLGLRSNVPTLAFDVTNFSYEYKSKIMQIMSDIGFSDFVFNNVYLEDKAKLIKEKLHYLIDHNDEVRQRIEHSLTIEKNKSNSFFLKLDQILMS